MNSIIEYLRTKKTFILLGAAFIAFNSIGYAQHESHAATNAETSETTVIEDHTGHDSATNTDSSQTVLSPDLGRVPVTLIEGQQQLINIRTTSVSTQHAVVKMSTVGIVTYNDTLIENINTKIMGWADVLHVDKPGQRVEKNDILLEIYSPELYSAQEEYLIAYNHCEKLKHLNEHGAQGATEEVNGVVKSAQTLLDSARKRLKLWDITDEEIATLDKAGEPSDRLKIRSPVSGFVINKNVDPGQMIRPGMTLYRIADLNSVWIDADVYEYELSLFSPGQKANVTAIAYPERKFTATVDFIYPFSETKTRTTTARLVIDNFESLLKPGMYVNVEVERNLGMQLMIPKNALFDTGKHQYRRKFPARQRESTEGFQQRRRAQPLEVAKGSPLQERHRRTAEK